MTILKEYKQVVKYHIEIESEIIDLLRKCFERIYGESAVSRCMYILEEDMETGMEYNGCLQGLYAYDREFKKPETVKEE